MGNVLYYDKTAVTPPKAPSSDPDGTCASWRRQLAQGRALSPREQFYYARELDAHDRQEEAAALWEAFLAEDQGWVENKREACRDLSACYLRMGQEEKAFAALTRELAFGPPRAELCCDLGNWFFPAGRLPHSSVLV